MRSVKTTLAFDKDGEVYTKLQVGLEADGIPLVTIQELVALQKQGLLHVTVQVTQPGLPLRTSRRENEPLADA